MTWIYYTLATAVLVTVCQIIEKNILKKSKSSDFSAGFTLINAIIGIPLLFSAKFTNVNAEVVLIIYALSWISYFAFYLTAKALRHMEISIVTPLASLQSGLVAILSTFILKEFLSIEQSIAIVLFIVGVYLLESRKFTEAFEPIRRLIKTPYFLVLLSSIMFYACGAIGDRYILSRFSIDSNAYLSLIQIFIALNALTMAYIKKDGAMEAWRGFKSGGWVLLFLCLLTVLHRITQLEAIKLQNVGLVLSLKNISVLLTTVVGGELFHEKNLPRKAVAGMCIVIGTILIILS